MGGVTYGLQIDVAGVACTNWVLPKAFQSRVIATTMLPQSDEFRKPMTRSTLC
jgi:hypothetical protein